MAFKRIYPPIEKLKPPRPLWVKVAVITLAVWAVLLVGGFLSVRALYQNRLLPLSSSTEKIQIEIEPGSTLSQIAAGLEEKRIIKSAWAFEWYVRLHGQKAALKAGTYEFSPSQNVKEIAEQIVAGKVAQKPITILPGKRLDEIKRVFKETGFSDEEIETALSRQLYQNHPALTKLPLGATLEGYLFPETFLVTSRTRASEIVESALDEMAKQFTPEIKAAIERQGLTLHQGVILASMLEQEVKTYEERTQAAQVFLTRFKRGMRLESDPTAKYGAILDGATPSLQYDSPYNTYLYVGLPVGPISNFSADALKAVANPAQTDWLYFVCFGADRKTYFTRTLSEHEALVNAHRHELCD